MMQQLELPGVEWETTNKKCDHVDYSPEKAVTVGAEVQTSGKMPTETLSRNLSVGSLREAGLLGLVLLGMVVHTPSVYTSETTGRPTISDVTNLLTTVYALYLLIWKIFRWIKSQQTAKRAKSNK